jgi:hypothetical protein
MKTKTKYARRSKTLKKTEECKERLNGVMVQTIKNYFANNHCKNANKSRKKCIKNYTKLFNKAFIDSCKRRQKIKTV